jgi:hypothetical protein
MIVFQEVDLPATRGFTAVLRSDEGFLFHFGTYMALVQKFLGSA